MPFLQAGGHEIQRLVRRKPEAPNEIFWDPSSGEIDARSLEGIDAVINLAGVSIAGKRWSQQRKDAILRSRVDSTQLLARTLANLKSGPSVFVSTSAVGYYGNGGDQILSESSPRGDGFLASVCEAWEEAALPAADAGIRVVHPRFGIVMAGEGGMLPLITKAFQFGLGGPIGDGDQYMSWIELDDLLAVLLESMSNRNLRGPVNAVAPQNVTSREFASILGDVLHRPSFFPAPEFAVRLAMGQMAEELVLFSQRAKPAVLTGEHFAFDFPDLESALRHELGKSNALPVTAISPSTQTIQREAA